MRQKTGRKKRGKGKDKKMISLQSRPSLAIQQNNTINNHMRVTAILFYFLALNVGEILVGFTSFYIFENVLNTENERKILTHRYLNINFFFLDLF